MARWEELALAMNAAPTESPYEAARRVAVDRELLGRDYEEAVRKCDAERQRADAAEKRASELETAARGVLEVTEFEISARGTPSYSSSHAMGGALKMLHVALASDGAHTAAVASESAATDDVPTGVGDSGRDPIPADAKIHELPTLRLRLVSFEHGDRFAIEVHGFTTDVETGKPTRIRTRGYSKEQPTAERLHDLVTTWFDHELREQLGMKPHVNLDSSTRSGDKK